MNSPSLYYTEVSGGWKSVTKDVMDTRWALKSEFLLPFEPVLPVELVAVEVALHSLTTWSVQ